jgi:hypothetical protein
MVDKAIVAATIERLEAEKQRRLDEKLRRATPSLCQLGTWSAYSEKIEKSTAGATRSTTARGARLSISTPRESRRVRRLQAANYSLRCAAGWPG